MKKLIPSKGQRRFLIIWIVFHLFALVINIIPIQGKVNDTPSGVLYIFTQGPSSEFWPFSDISHKSNYTEIRNGYYDYSTTKKVTHFYGIFNGYGIEEFLVYVSAGLLIVFLPKLW